MSYINIIVYLIGSFFVITFALRFFNSPPGFKPTENGVADILKLDPELVPALPKYLTDRTRYSLYSWLFVGITLAMYFFVSFLFPYVVAGYWGEAVTVSATAAIVLGTLLFIGLSPKLPFIKNMLEDYKQDLYKKAQIPDKGMKVFRSLMFGELDKNSDEFKRVLNVMLSDKCKHDVNSSLDETYYDFNKGTIERNWARLIYLVFCVETWSDEEPFKRHIDSGSLCWLELKSMCTEKLLSDMIDYKNGGVLSDDDKDDLLKRLEHTLIRIYWLITLLLFMSNKGGENPDNYLKEIGWVINPDKYFKFSMRHVFFTGTIVVAAILLGAACSWFTLYMIKSTGTLDTIAAINSKELLNWVVYGVPMFIVPLFSTLMIKRFLSMNDTWRVRRPEDEKEKFSKRPWEIYAPVAFISYLFTVAVLVTIASFLELPEGKGMGDVVSSLFMYCILSAVTSFYVCYLIDSPCKDWEKDYRYYLKSFFPAVLQGGINMMIITFSFVYFTKHQTFDFDLMTDLEKGKLIAYNVTSFILGVAMHFTSRVGSKYYDRRELNRVVSEGGWWTITVATVTRRVKAVKESLNSLELIADNDLRAVVDVGSDAVFYQKKDLPKKGTISSLNGDKLTISLIS